MPSGAWCSVCSGGFSGGCTDRRATCFFAGVFYGVQGSWTGSSSFANRLTVTMLTGDNERSAQRIARKLGIANVQTALRWAGCKGAECLPARGHFNLC